MRQIMAVCSEQFDHMARVSLEGFNVSKEFMLGEGDSLVLSIRIDVVDGEVLGEITGQRETIEIEESPDDGTVKSRRHSG